MTTGSMYLTGWTAWNIILALVPVAAAYFWSYGATWFRFRRRRIAWLLWAPVALIWFAFLPNTCYLLTEWRHFLWDPQFTHVRNPYAPTRAEMLSVATWALFYLLYSGVGMLCFALAIRPVARMLRRTHVHPLAVGVPFFFLTSLGVYMGLIERLHSWDIVSRPGPVMRVATHAMTHPRLLQAIIVFAVLLWLMYIGVDIWIDGVAARLRLTHGARK